MQLWVNSYGVNAGGWTVEDAVVYARALKGRGCDYVSVSGGGLVLDATINPDFGQAEVDPAVVNLTAYETFFDEKRRFFRPCILHSAEVQQPATDGRGPACRARRVGFGRAWIGRPGAV